MSARSTPPFRADQVGSLLRPRRLLEAREQFLGAQTANAHLGPHDHAGLQAVEDDCVREAVAMQEAAGLRAVTDGEFRRRSWWLDLIMGWQGVRADRTASGEFIWRNENGSTQAGSKLFVEAPIRWRPSATVRAFEFLRSAARAVPKVTIPAPSMVHFMVGGDRGVVAGGAYSDPEAFWADVVAAYRQEIRALVAAGARYVQLDDTSIAFLCDPAHRQTMAAWGLPPDRLLEEYARRINDVVAGMPADVTFTLHQCRGNREGQWQAEGGYDLVADVLFNKIDVHGYFLEYDTARAGGFEPLRLLPKGKVAVLGLVSSKRPELEGADTLKRRIGEACRHADAEQLALSPQCGFASSIKGNPLTDADQAAKLRRIVDVARDVWGGV